MSRPFQVGITGGIGSGKSTVCRIFSSLGIPVYDADTRAKELMTTDGILIEQIKKEFGTLSYLPDGNLNRDHLRQAAFGNAERLKALNSLVHPRVAADYAKWVEAHAQSPYLIREAALLFEAGAAAALGCVVFVHAPESIRIRRVLVRDPHRSENDIRNIIANQWPEEEKMKRADEIIHNDDNHLIIPQVLRLHQQFLLSRPQATA